MSSEHPSIHLQPVCRACNCHATSQSAMELRPSAWKKPTELANLCWSIQKVKPLKWAVPAICVDNALQRIVWWTHSMGFPCQKPRPRRPFTSWFSCRRKKTCYTFPLIRFGNDCRLFFAIASNVKTSFAVRACSWSAFSVVIINLSIDIVCDPRWASLVARMVVRMRRCVRPTSLLFQ